MKNLNDLIRIQDVAEKANTSIGTVDRVIHNRPGVSEATRQRVLKVLKDFNYKPNLIARNLAGKKVYKIAVLIPDPSEAFWKIHHEGINKAREELKPFGIDIDTFIFDFHSREEYLFNLEKIEEIKSDAILTVPVHYKEIISFLKKTKMTSVFFDTNTDEAEGLETHYIGEDAYQTGMVAGKLLSPGVGMKDSLLSISIGNRISPYLRWTDREIGFRDFFSKETSLAHTHQLQFLKIELTELDSSSVEEKIKKTFADHPEITRVFINSCRGTSLCAPFLLNEKLKRKNLKVIGYDLTDNNIYYLKNGVIDYLIDKHPREQCYQGIKMLYEKLVLKVPIPARTYMPIDIIVKENVDYYKMLQVGS